MEEVAQKESGNGTHIEEKNLVNSYARMYDENEFDRNESENASILLQVSSERVFPPAPYPRKYLHCVINDLDCIVQAAYALQADGHAGANIHVMACWDYVAACERRGRQQNGIAKMLGRFLSLLNDDSDDIYLCEALRGNHVLLLHLPRYDQLTRVCDMLNPYNARHIKYIDTWTVNDLSSENRASDS